MIRSLTGKKLMVAVISACISLSALAGGWDWTKPYAGPRSTITTLIITANYNLPRIMADIIQVETSQPYLLLPSKGQTRIFFCPGHQKDALEVKEADLTRFIAFLNPQQIIVLGDEHYVPAKYIRAIPQDYTTMIISNNDWNKVAKTLSHFFNKQNIYYDFQSLSKKFLYGNLYAPTKTTKPVKAETSAAPAAATVTVPSAVPSSPVPAASIDTEAAPAAAPAPAAVAPVAAPAPAAAAPVAAPAVKSSAEPELVVPDKSPVLVEEKK